MPPSKYSPDLIRTDFDRLATAGVQEWDSNAHYHDFLLSQLAASPVMALDVGCGRGDFAALLAKRAEHVVAIDLSPEMLRVARERTAGTTNIEFIQADLMEYPLPPARFDVVVSIAALHHVPYEAALANLAQAVRPGGTLAILDLVKAATPWEYALGALAMPVSRWHRWRNTGKWQESPEVRAAWDAHWKHDKIMQLNEIRAIAACVVPRAIVRRHLLWRYSLLWRKP